MPQSQIENDHDHIRNLAHTPAMREIVDDFFKVLKEHNKFNFRALIKVCEMDITAVDISDMSYGEDYELGAYYKPDDGPEIRADRMEDAIEAAKEKLDEADDAVGEQEDIITEIEDHPTMPEAEKAIELEAAKAKLAELEKAQREADDYHDELKRCYRRGPETNECMWNTVWIYRRFDEDAAEEAGLGTGRFLDGGKYESDDNFVHLFGCGMNLSPHIAAYEALVYGGVHPDRVEQFKDIGYCSSTMGGDALFAKVTKILGIDGCLKQIEQEQKERMAAFDAACAKARQIRKDLGDADPVLGQIAAMACLSQHLK